MPRPSDPKEPWYDDNGDLRSPKGVSRVSHPHLHGGDDRSATEGEPQRGEGDDDKLPTIEHVEGDEATRVNADLPAEKTDSEKSKEDHARKTDADQRSKVEHSAGKVETKTVTDKKSGVDPSLRKK